MLHRRAQNTCCLNQTVWLTAADQLQLFFRSVIHCIADSQGYDFEYGGSYDSDTYDSGSYDSDTRDSDTDAQRQSQKARKTTHTKAQPSSLGKRKRSSHGAVTASKSSAAKSSHAVLSGNFALLHHSYQLYLVSARLILACRRRPASTSWAI
eukprot:8138-Heterococcus_DN1.PRE.2